MYSNKTQATTEDVSAFVQGLEDPQQREDCQRLVDIMQAISGQPPVMWGSNIVGFGRYHYRYASGKAGEFMRVGFSPRKGKLSLYIISGFDGNESLLAHLGPHKTGKSCLYIKHLNDVKEEILLELIQASLTTMATRYPD